MEKKTVSNRALFGRINRRLAKDGEVLKTTRARWESTLGTFHIVDVSRGLVVHQHVDVLKLADELGVLGPDEQAAP